MVSRAEYQNLEEDEPFSTEIHSKVSWDHIQNLDKFFSNIYYFHQQHGFYVTFIEFLLQILKFFFIIWITSVFTELCSLGFAIIVNNNIKLECFYYPIIFKSQNNFTIALVVISYLLLGLFILNSLPKLHQFFSISKFYRDALKIKDDAIPDKTWFEILRALIEVQKELPLCVHKPLLSELDIYHRILRRQNYLVAMMNQEKFPMEIKIPFLGTFVIVTKYYLDSIKYMLFKFPFKCPFGDHWQLRTDYKKLASRSLLIRQIDQIFVFMGIIQLLISPICFFYLLITKACTYGHSFKINPSHCINREVTPFGRIFLAHFNELPHEFSYRISKAYPAANQYLDSFTSKILVSIARLVRFLSGGIIIIGFLISMVDSKFLMFPHVITLAAVITFIYSISLKLIPDETVVVNPKLLIHEVLNHVHYIPDEWKDKAHTKRVYNEFSKLFQPKIVDITKELFSCFWTPFVFIFWMPKYSGKIVDFLRNFTTDMHGVGDICSFAELDIRKHGSANWSVSVLDDRASSSSRSESLKNGKVELSLVNFYTNNPNCPVNEPTKKFINDLKSIETQTMPSLNNIPSIFPTINNNFSDLNQSNSIVLKNASKCVGPNVPSHSSLIRNNNINNNSSIIDNYSNAIDNYFHGANIPASILLSNSQNNSILIDNYRSHYESIRGGLLSRTADINVSISMLHSVHDRRRMGLLTMQVDQIISEAEEDSYQMRPPLVTNSSSSSNINNALDLSSVPTP
uniref:Autophagy-related protein 9 n=1 Tax=Dugesia japonica TaxID=6161 RepID=A0A2S1BJF6_DUGJA|nr:Atg9 [Dugesia japonica]